MIYFYLLKIQHFAIKLTTIPSFIVKHLIKNFLCDRKQRVVLNGLCSSWADIRTGVLQGSILGSLLFFIYINDLSNDIKSKCKLFSRHTFLFSVVRDIDT